MIRALSSSSRLVIAQGKRLSFSTSTYRQGGRVVFTAPSAVAVAHHTSSTALLAVGAAAVAIAWKGSASLQQLLANEHQSRETAGKLSVMATSSSSSSLEVFPDTEADETAARQSLLPAVV